MQINQNIHKLIVVGLLTSGISLAADVGVESMGFNAGITKITYIVDSQVTTTPKTVGSSFELYSTLSNVFANKNIKPTFSYIYNRNSDVKNHTALVGLNQYYQFNYFDVYSGLLVGYGKLELNNDYSLKSVVGAAQVGLEFPMSQHFSFNFNSKFFVHNYESNLNSAPYMVSASVGLKYTFSTISEESVVSNDKEKSLKIDDNDDDDWDFDDTIDLEPSNKKSIKPTPKEVEKKVQKQVKVQPLEEKKSDKVIPSKVVVKKIKTKKIVKNSSPKKVQKSAKSQKKSFDEMNVDEMDFDWLLDEDSKPSAKDSHKKPVDSDHDGVIDKEDLCMDTIAGEIVDSSGCAKDSDGDGIIDRLDRCSNSIANEIVDQDGCAKDSDGDGVVDRVDQCINSPKDQVVNEFGCSGKMIDTKTKVTLHQHKPVKISKPQVKEIQKPVKTVTKVSGYPTRLNFPYKAQKVDKKQVKQLDKLAAYLIAHPEYELFMKSYTDSIGSAKYNYNLALKRAKSVTSQLIQRGVNRARISYESMGEKEPLVSNMLKSGREKNRRIDIFLIKR